MADAHFEKLCASSGILVLPYTTRESEVYLVELFGLRLLELIIVPDISRGAARASLKSLRLS
jgi:hypothetical protein